MTLSGRLSSQSALLTLLSAFLILYAWLRRTSPVASLEAQLQDPARFGFPAWYWEEAKEGRGKDVLSLRGSAGKSISALVVFDSQTASTTHLTLIDQLLNRSPATIDPTLYDTSWPNNLLRMETSSGGCLFDSVWLLGEASLGSLHLPPSCLNIPTLLQPTLTPASRISPLLPLRSSGITLLDTPSHGQLDALITEAYREDPPTTKWLGGKPDEGNGGRSVKNLGLYGHLAPVADDRVFHPRKGGWLNWPKSLSWLKGGRRPRITVFLHPRSSSSLTDKHWHHPWSWKTHTLPSPRRADHPTIWPFIRSHPAQLRTILKRHRNSQRKLARVMAKSDVCIFEGEGEDGWDGGLLTEGAVQAMMSGCVVAGVVPSLHRQALEDIYLAIPPSPYQTSANTSYLSITLQDVLRSTPDVHSFLARRNLLGVILARGEMSWGDRWGAVERLIEGYNEGKRGFEFPHGYAIDCDHDSGSSGWKAPWCRGASRPVAQGFWDRWKPF